SFRDLGHLYSQNDRYAAAMRQTGNPRQFAREIAAAGYATTPGYGDKLIQLMDSQNLYQYDLKTDDARFIDQSDYLTLSPGASFQIYFELRNSGANVWRAHDGYSLRNDNAQVMGAARQQELADDIPPEDSVRWTIPMTAPLEPGRYRTEWRMYHGDTPFGPELYIEVTVQEQPPPVISRDFASPALVLLLASALLGGLSSYLLLVRHIKTSKA
ncbi:MAG: NBR1-Ig-like domain-containing protein, partial [Rudaea sp.]